MLQPENHSKKYDALFSDIDTGRTKVPMFQRDFVWGKEQTAKLIDSIIKGYPIGTFILWKTREELRSVRNIGNIKLPEIPKGDSAFYVLDGQQRITSLYAVRKGIRLTKDGEEIDYSRISINLDLDPDTDDRIVTVDSCENATCITVFQLLNGSVAEFAREYPKHLNKVDIYRTRLTGYDFSTIEIPDYPMDIACEVFTRINTGGTELTLFEIMEAKTYDLDKKFDLAEEYENLLDNKGKSKEKDLEDAHFDTIAASTVLQCIAAHLVKSVKRSDILKLKKSEFIEAWPVVKDGIFVAVDYFRSHFRVPVSHLLPYDALLVPFSYFFIRRQGKRPTALQEKLLTQYFWWASLSKRFSSGVEGKLAQDIEKIERILTEKLPDYRGEEVQIELDDLLWRWFSPGDAFCKAILCLYAYHQPRSFSNDHLVKIDNSWLKTANSVNYHHFFPRSYLEKEKWKNWEANCILNITIVDDYLNKRTIGAKAPAVYMKTFKRDNKHLADTMATHLINDLNSFGVWRNDYETFLEMRGQKVLAEIKKRLPPKMDQFKGIPDQDDALKSETEEKGQLQAEDTSATILRQECQSILRSDECNHPILEDNSNWLDIYKKYDITPQWAGVYRWALRTVGINTAGDFAAAIMALGLEPSGMSSGKQRYRFAKPLSDGKRVEINTHHFGGWAWHLALLAVEKRGFDWKKYMVN